MYPKYKKKYQSEVYRNISELLDEAKKAHEVSFTANNSKGDLGQSWKSVKGKGLEKLIFDIINDSIADIGLELYLGSKLDITKTKNLAEPLVQIKNNLKIDYKFWGKQLPDLDLIIYNPEAEVIIALVSVKVTLRERIAQTGYWKYKLAENELTSKIKVLFVTLDQDKTLIEYQKASGGIKKGAAIAAVDTDGVYIMTKEIIPQLDNVKGFGEFINDLSKFKNEI